HPQVRVALSRLAYRTVSARGGALPRALAALSRGSAREAGDLLPGGGGRRRAAQPGGKGGLGGAAQRQSGRLFLVRGRAAWLPQGRQHSALPRCRTRLLCDRSLPDWAHVLTGPLQADLPNSINDGEIIELGSFFAEASGVGRLVKLLDVVQPCEGSPRAFSQTF